jgi:hypothetical protein
MDVEVNNYGWVEFEGMTASITEGDFYLAMKQTSVFPNVAPVGVDLDNPGIAPGALCLWGENTFYRRGMVGL